MDAVILFPSWIDHRYENRLKYMTSDPLRARWWIELCIYTKDVLYSIREVTRISRYWCWFVQGKEYHKNKINVGVRCKMKLVSAELASSRTRGFPWVCATRSWRTSKAFLSCAFRSRAIASALFLQCFPFQILHMVDSALFQLIPCQWFQFLVGFLLSIVEITAIIPNRDEEE